MVSYMPTVLEVDPRIDALQERVNYAEKLREKDKNPKAAIIVLDIVVKDAHTDRLFIVARNALAQLFVCYKHLYDQDRGIAYLDFMGLTIQEGLDLQLPESEKHVFYYRRGDLMLLQKQWNEAKLSYEDALNIFKRANFHLEDSRKGTYGEYLKGLAKALYALKMYSWAEIESLKGIDAIEDAIYEPDSQWRRSIHLSGVYAVLAKISFKRWRFAESWGYAHKAFTLSNQLEADGFGVRKLQLRQTIGKFFG